METHEVGPKRYCSATGEGVETHNPWVRRAHTFRKGRKYWTRSRTESVRNRWTGWRDAGIQEPFIKRNTVSLKPRHYSNKLWRGINADQRRLLWFKWLILRALQTKRRGTARWSDSVQITHVVKIRWCMMHFIVFAICQLGIQLYCYSNHHYVRRLILWWMSEEKI